MDDTTKEQILRKLASTEMKVYAWGGVTTEREILILLEYGTLKVYAAPTVAAELTTERQVLLKLESGELQARCHDYYPPASALRARERYSLADILGPTLNWADELIRRKRILLRLDSGELDADAAFELFAESLTEKQVLTDVGQLDVGAASTLLADFIREKQIQLNLEGGELFLHMARRLLGKPMTEREILDQYPDTDALFHLMRVREILLALSSGEVDVAAASKLLARLLRERHGELSPDAVQRREKYRQALRHYRHGELSEAIRLEPDFASAYLMRASCYIRESRYDAAIADLDRAIELEPENVGAYCERGLAYLRKDDNGKAIADFNYAIRLHPEGSNSLWRSYIGYRRAAYLKYALHNMGEASCDELIAFWSEAIELDPAFDAPGMSEVLHAAARAVRIVDWGRTDLTHSGYDSLASAYGIRASEYVGKAEYDKAIVDCFNTIRTDLLREKAEQQRDQEQDEEEQNEEEQDEEEDFGKAEEEDRDEEEDEFGEAVWLNRENPKADFYRWLAWLCGGRFEEAIADLDEAVRLAPEDGAVHVCRAIFRIAKGDFNVAIADLDVAVRLDPRDAVALFCRGVAYGGKGRYDEAIADLEKAMGLEPKNAAAYCCRAIARLGRARGFWDRIASARMCRAIARLGKARAQADADFEEAKRLGYPATWWKPASAGPAKEPDWDRINDELSQQTDAYSWEAEGHGAPAIGPEAGEGPPNCPDELPRTRLIARDPARSQD